MSPTAAAVLASWRLEPGLASLLLLTSLLYLRGWTRVRRQLPREFPTWRAATFHAGLATLYIAIASPLDAFAALLLQVHMVQHLLLMIVAPALLLLGAPAVPLLRGLPDGVAKEILGPFLAAPEVRRLGRFLSHPVLCWLAMSAATWIWHAPGPYQLALRSPAWHAVEHASFLAAGLLFWWPVVQPWPSEARWPGWTMPLFLLLADVQNTVLAAIFIFSERLLYPIYGDVPRLAGITAQADQTAAGALMWVPMSLAFLVPAAVMTVRLLSPQRQGLGTGGWGLAGKQGLAGSKTQNQPPAPSPQPLAAVFRSALFRRTLQTVMFALAAAIVADGFLGPQMSPMNLAGVLPWTYWRGLTVVALLLVGNLFCMACPLTLPRDLARRLGLGRLAWPRALRSKWIAVALLMLFFWAYEVLGLWDSPRATAAVVVAYFTAALIIDATFRGASFCKYVCPIGQFHFVHSLLSPLEVGVRQPSICASCTTHDCLRGGPGGRGCDTELFLPRKSSSLDCTFCLDCARACPHDNVALVAATPGAELWRDPDRASIGRLSRRLDIAVLALVLTAAAAVSAAAMVEPVLRWEADLAAQLGLASTALVSTLVLLAGIGLLPTAMIGAAGIARRALAGAPGSGREIFCRLAVALVPLGGSIWAAHFLFHLLSGWASLAPVLQRIAGSTPDWSMPAPLLGPESMLQLQILLLDAGLLLALYSGWRVAEAFAADARRAVALLLPWAFVAVALYGCAAWIFLQPMEMRGMMMSH